MTSECRVEIEDRLTRFKIPSEGVFEANDDAVGEQEMYTRSASRDDIARCERLISVPDSAGIGEEGKIESVPQIAKLFEGHQFQT